MKAIRFPNSGDVLGARLDVGRQAQEQTTAKLLLVYTMWVLLLFEPDGFIGAHGLAFLLHTFTWSLIPVCAVIIFCGRREAFYWPYLLIIAIHVIWLPFAVNTGLVRRNLLMLMPFFLIFALTVSVIDTPRRALLLVKLALLQFIWYGVQGIPAGLVWWNGNLANEDSYGPLMVLGFGFSYYFATGTNSKVFRYLSVLAGFLCIAGAVLSFARGAMLALCVVMGTILIRSRKKLAFLGYGLIAVIVGLIVIQVAFPGGKFWAEMQTIQEVDEQDGRFVLWGLAWELFRFHPIFGVGPGNFGPNASEHFTGPLGGGFDNPAMLYFWEPHNDFVKILVEQGVLGIFAMGAMLVGFYNRLRFLRTEGAWKRWHDDTSGFIDLRNLCLGLEVTMIAYLACSFFYNQLQVHWFWSLFALAYVLANVTRATTADSLAHDLR